MATITTVTGRTVTVDDAALNRIADSMSFQDPGTIRDMLNCFIARSLTTGSDDTITTLDKSVAIVRAHQDRELALAEVGTAEELAAYRADMAQRYGIGVRNA